MPDRRSKGVRCLPSRAVAVQALFRVPLARRCCRTTQPLDAPAARESHRVVPTSSHVASGGLASIYRKKKNAGGRDDGSLVRVRAGSAGSLSSLRYRGTELLHSSLSGTKPHWRARGEMPLVPSSAIFVVSIPSGRPKRTSIKGDCPTPYLMPPCFCSLILRPVSQCCLARALYSRKSSRPPPFPCHASRCPRRLGIYVAQVGGLGGLRNEEDGSSYDKRDGAKVGTEAPGPGAHTLQPNIPCLLPPKVVSRTICRRYCPALFASK